MTCEICQVTLEKPSERRTVRTRMEADGYAREVTCCPGCEERIGLNYVTKFIESTSGQVFVAKWRERFQSYFPGDMYDVPPVGIETVKGKTGLIVAGPSEYSEEHKAQFLELCHLLRQRVNPFAVTMAIIAAAFILAIAWRLLTKQPI